MKQKGIYKVKEIKKKRDEVSNRIYYAVAVEYKEEEIINKEATITIIGEIGIYLYENVNEGEYIELETEAEQVYDKDNNGLDVVSGNIERITVYDKDIEMDYRLICEDGKIKEIERDLFFRNHIKDESDNIFSQEFLETIKKDYEKELKTVNLLD